MAIAGSPRRRIRLAAFAAVFACVAFLAQAVSASAASFDYSPQPALTGLEITFEADVDDASLRWDLDGNGSIDSTDARPSVKYMRPGTYHAKLLLGDGPDQQEVVQPIIVGQLLAPFITSPTTPLAGQDVLLVYGGQAEQSVPIESYDWELDGDNDFNDASGFVLHRTFPVPGDYLVGLKVTDKDGAFGSEFREIHVRSATTVTQTSLRLLSPFPVTRISGRVTSRGALIRRLTAVAPIGARVTVRCSGRGCPFRKSTRVVRRAKRASKATTATVRFRRMERHLLRGGATIKVFVTRPGWIGKYTRWKIRKSKPPQRRDLCLTPGVSAPGACPGA